MLQFAVKEIQLGMISMNPAVPHQKVVDLVGEYNLLKFHALLAKHGNQFGHLTKINIAVVVTLYQEHR